VAAAAAAAVAAEQEQQTAKNTVTVSTVPPPSAPKSSPSKTSLTVKEPPSRSRSSAGSELRSAKQTLQERDRQLNRVSLRSREMNDSAANFAAVAQGFLDLSNSKKK